MIAIINIRITGKGTTPTYPAPRKLKPSGRPEIGSPPEYMKLKPRIMFITTKVAMKEGIFPITVRTPLIMPTIIDIRITIKTASQTGRPIVTTNPAKKIDTIPMMEDIDISMLPVRITKNSPMEIIAIKDACRIILNKFFGSLNLLIVSIHIVTNAINNISIIQSDRNDLMPPPYLLVFSL